MTEKISFEIESTEKFLDQLLKLNEVFQQDWSRVLNQWESIKITWQDKQFSLFEAGFQELLLVYKRSEKDCEEYIREIKQQIEIAKKYQQISKPGKVYIQSSIQSTTSTDRPLISSTTSNKTSKNAANLPNNGMKERVKKLLTKLDSIKHNVSSNVSNIQHWEMRIESRGQVEVQYIYAPVLSLSEKQEAQSAIANNLNSNIFADFVSYSKKTLNLFNPLRIEPLAAAIAACLIQDKNPEVMISSIVREKWSEDEHALLVRLETPTNADYDALSLEYFSYLHHFQLLSLKTLQEILAVLSERNTEIDKIAKMLEGEIDRPKIVFNNHIRECFMTNKYGVQIENISGEVQVGDRTYHQGMNVAEIQELVQSLMENLQQPAQSVVVQPTSLRKILFLAANPTDQVKLNLEGEVRTITDVLRQAKYREQFSLERRSAVRREELQSELLHEEPEIVHFSGHGAAEHGLVLQSETGKTQFVSTEALTDLFELMKDNVKCVVLNACYSEVQAKAISQHIDYVVGMDKAIGDKAAIIFASAFYLALASGRSIKDAHKFGCNAIHLQGIPEHLTPKLLPEAA